MQSLSGPGRYPDERRQIRIGQFTSLSGDTRVLGLACNKGIQLAVHEINQQGGIQNHLLDLETVDDSTPVGEFGSGSV